GGGVGREGVTEEVASAELVGGEAAHGDRVRAVEDVLDRERVLVPLEPGHLARSSACSRSQIRSSTDSVPTESLIVPGPTPAASSSASPSWRWVVLAGWMIRLFASPTLARCDQSVSPRISSSPPLRPPAQSNEKIAPAPSGRYFSTSGSVFLPGQPREGTVRAQSGGPQQA